MRVSVSLFSTLRQYAPEEKGELTMEIRPDSPVSRFVDALGIPPAVQRVILVNGRHAKPHIRLSDGDTVTLFPPMTGG